MKRVDSILSSTIGLHICKGHSLEVQFSRGITSHRCFGQDHTQQTHEVQLKRYTLFNKDMYPINIHIQGPVSLFMRVTYILWQN